ncbi:DUF58 domain-containing protein [Candidatus Dependentiae bacterium]|nr:DUF58 domain-containing protein [Candidatus Dependentiae bacterium]
MINRELAARVKELELHTRRLLTTSGIGATRSKQRGFGFEFDQLRSYQYGDDVRLIDWKSSARNPNNLNIRQYLEERNREFIICLDISASTIFGSDQYAKSEIMQQVTGVLALAAAWSGDKVGLILFSDHVEYMVAPRKGNFHVHNLIETIFSYKPKGKMTDINALCDFIARKSFKKANFLVISDFIAPDYLVGLKKIVKKQNVIAIHCMDIREEKLDDVGFVWMQDLETEKQILVNTKKGSCSLVSKSLEDRNKNQKVMLQKLGIEVFLLKNQQTFMHDLISFFKKRMIY